ncbi:helix-turn-helix domain-containing protein [Clostridium estertheticum]|uniref:helix-turn-helix domain-containing protein n=1 Tax=Clostridium estertheticum TaxID=238834 RepID=UPI0013E936C0|nr:helix-turn-helix transcriptional regulator [Clostridium estertheticum]MBZ9684967.1 helix-turn-helix domain-containing protein [Clostridium estertheticum]
MGSYKINLGNLIKEKRLQKGLNIQQLSTILNVSVGFMSNLENAKTDTFNIDLMSNLCKSLGMSPLDFIPEPNIDMDLDLRLDNIYQSESLFEFPEANKKLITRNATAIANAYIESIRHHSYDMEFIKKFTVKILSEINYINDFKIK